jgi:hypothetical protein
VRVLAKPSCQTAAPPSPPNTQVSYLGDGFNHLWLKRVLNCRKISFCGHKGLQGAIQGPFWREGFVKTVVSKIWGTSQFWRDPFLCILWVWSRGLPCLCWSNRSTWQRSLLQKESTVSYEKARTRIHYPVEQPLLPAVLESGICPRHVLLGLWCLDMSCQFKESPACLGSWDMVGKFPSHAVAIWWPSSDPKLSSMATCWTYASATDWLKMCSKPRWPRWSLWAAKVHLAWFTPLTLSSETWM